MSWFMYALLGMVFFSAMVLVFKKLTALGVKTSALLLLVFLFGALFYGAHTLVTKTPVKINYSIIVLLAAAALSSYIANLFYVKSIELAPNPAYPTAIVGLQVGLIAIGSILFFGSEFNWIKGVGLLLTIVAIVLLSL